MAPPFKRHMFRGELRTVREIASILGLPEMTVYNRVHFGRELDAPRHESFVVRDEEPPMVDKSVRYAQDIECRVARLVCGGACDQRQLAALWNVSYQRIQQYEQAAMDKIRAMAEFSADARALLQSLDEVRAERECERPLFRSTGWKSAVNVRRSA